MLIGHFKSEERSIPTLVATQLVDSEGIEPSSARRHYGIHT